ncbi:secreted seminal-vesicle Ly-6 protein 1-like [Nannospalax galili]|uniref:Secreted seminal-vesicle Ly-6 protein 1-like n=1 Tax=Nannospalax galili TaxID=1026970 RepID=A0A8C6W3R8_NANGA|nr:secreted seminal-vesicle Ly-6 protein 1-like [Nannospalax galili]
MGKFLLIILLLETFSLVFFRAEALMCKVCSSFKRGHCLVGKGNCTTNFYSQCRTRNFFIYSPKDGWLHNHTELDCSALCLFENAYYEYLKISTFCCKDQDFCNKFHGQIMTEKIY